MNYLEEYDETDPISIETYAKRLIGKTFADVCRQDDITKATVPVIKCGSFSSGKISA